MAKRRQASFFADAAPAAERSSPTSSPASTSSASPASDRVADDPSDALSESRADALGAEPFAESPASDELAPLDEAGEPLPPGATPNLAGKSIWVIDSPSLIFQVFHAIPEMTGPAGEPTNAVYGFANDLFRIIREKKPDYLFCAFDTSAPTFRDELYEEYKTGRAEMPVDLSAQWPVTREMLSALAIPLLEQDGQEADDILATLARIGDEAGADVYLVTSDKDVRQCITDRVKVFSLRKRIAYGAKDLFDDWGITPAQVVDYQGLVGDAVDKIPGVPLIGPKIAKELLDQYGTLDAVLDAAPSMKAGKRKDNLINFREQALLSRKLATLNPNVDVFIDWEQGKPGGIDADKAEKLFARLGFKRLADEMRALNLSVQPAHWDADYRLVETEEKFAAFLAELQQQTHVSVDTETTSVHPRDAELVGMSFAWTPGVGYYLPVRAPAGAPRLDLETTIAALKPFFENPAIEKIGQNLKYDMIVLRNVGVALRGVKFDTMIASYLLDAGERSHNMDALSDRYLHHKTVKIAELIGTGKKQKQMDEVPLDQIAYYAAEDADVVLRLEPPLAKRIAEEELEELLADVETPLIDVLAEMEYVGMMVDVKLLGRLSEQYAEKMKELEQEIYVAAGREFNINSPKQLQQILFTELNLPVKRKVSTGASTDADVLAELAPLHPLPAKIVDYRQYAKLKGTYLDALPALASPKTGRIHASFNQHVAATGRLSSSDPNLQNIPIRTEMGREIRAAFIPGEPGWTLLCADYSQIELRILAHYTGDETLTRAFEEDQDIHALVASQVNNVPLDQVTKDMRRAAKTVNFGVIYGQSGFGLSKQLGIPKEEAETFIDEYFKRYPGVEHFLTQTLADARRDGYVKTVLGRRRRIDGVRAEVGRQRNLAERTAVNTVIQGSAADLIKLSMILLHRRLKAEGFQSRMLLQIHDELVFEAPPHEVDRLARLVVESMTSVLPLNVPLKVDASIGPNWLETTPWRPAQN
ncbi:MAG TPA: DNA polymerase I [Pirellulales bacterium]